MKYKLRIYDIWEVGHHKDAKGRPKQEVSLFPAAGRSTDADRLFILCDGMGGHAAGEVASSTVCEAMSRTVFAARPDAEGYFTQADFDNALSAAYDALDLRDNGAAKKMGTTMTFLKLCKQGACVAHMGNSRVYQIRPGKTEEDTQILFKTEDHSLVNNLVRLGKLTEEEARPSRKRNVITRAMQPNQERRLKADIRWLTDIQVGDYFYLCSDGMLEKMTDRQLCHHFSEAGDNDTTKVVNLIRATEENRDNHAAFIIHILEVETEETALPSLTTEMAARHKKKYTLYTDKPRPFIPGVSLPPEEDDDMDEPQPTFTVTQKSKRKGFLIAVPLLLVTVICVINVFFLKEKPKEPKAEYTTKVIQNDSIKLKMEVSTYSDGKIFKNSQGEEFTYWGETVAGLPDDKKGKGIYTDGTYNGCYVDGIREGQGTFQTSDGRNHFEGIFKGDQYSKGRLTIKDGTESDGSYFVGTFKENYFHTGVWYDKYGLRIDSMYLGKYVMSDPTTNKTISARQTANKKENHKGILNVAPRSR